MAKFLTCEEERELYTQLTSMADIGFKNRIIPAEGNKVSFASVLEKFRGYDFSKFFALLKIHRGSGCGCPEYIAFIKEHPLVELLGKFIECGFLDENLNERPNLYIELGKDIMPKTTLRNLKISEGLILRDGKLLPVKSKEAHRLGTMWLYLNGFKVEDAVRYTSDYLDHAPVFSSTSDYIERETNEIAISYDQATAMYNIYVAKTDGRKPFEIAVCGFTDLCLLPMASQETMCHNAKVLETSLGRDVFNGRKVLEEIKKEQYLMAREI